MGMGWRVIMGKQSRKEALQMANEFNRNEMGRNCDENGNAGQR